MILSPEQFERLVERLAKYSKAIDDANERRLELFGKTMELFEHSDR